LANVVSGSSQADREAGSYDTVAGTTLPAVSFSTKFVVVMVAGLIGVLKTALMLWPDAQSIAPAVGEVLTTVGALLIGLTISAWIWAGVSAPS
jgi:hypothetical protein